MGKTNTLLKPYPFYSNTSNWSLVNRLFYSIVCVMVCFAFLATSAKASVFTFAALGDTQDTSTQGLTRLNTLIHDINRQQPAFTVHVGEFKGGRAPCDHQYYQRVLHTANQFSSPLIYLPGDNDWTDCFHSNVDPLERLRYLRGLLYPKATSLGQTPMPLSRQSAQEKFTDFPENVWWEYEGVVFASFHNVGTNNNLYSDQQAINEHLQRNAANLAWLEYVFARASSAKAVVLFTHANLQFGTPAWQPTGFDDFRSALGHYVRQYPRPVLLVHGDTHQHKIDKPLKYQRQTVANFTRLEVFGSPDLGVVYIHVYPDSEQVFHFEPVAVNLVD